MIPNTPNERDLDPNKDPVSSEVINPVSERTPTMGIAAVAELVSFPVKRELPDTYSDLGGQIYRSPEQQVDGSFLAALRNEQEVVPDNLVELHRILDLQLDRLSPELIKTMLTEERRMLALHTHILVERMTSRSRTLATEGNETHPAFENYNFSSYEEASAYARQLAELNTSLKNLPSVRTLKQIYQSEVKLKKSKEAQAKMAKLYTGSKVIITDKGKARLFQEPDQPAAIAS